MGGIRPPEAAPSARRRRVLIVTGAVLAAAGAVGAALWIAAESTPTFSGTVVTLGSTSGCDCAAQFYPNATFPARVTVSVHWADESGGVVEFLYIGPTGGWLPCGATGASGECSFASTGGVYAFTAWNAAAQSAQTVRYSGSY